MNMKNEEAIKGLLNVKMQMSEESPFTKAVDLAIEALKKQIPKKPTPIDWKQYEGKVIYADYLRGGYWCPNCGQLIKSGDYCVDCGQKLDWGEGE